MVQVALASLGSSGHMTPPQLVSLVALSSHIGVVIILTRSVSDTEFAVSFAAVPASGGLPDTVFVVDDELSSSPPQPSHRLDASAAKIQRCISNISIVLSSVFMVGRTPKRASTRHV